jgi:hypothetical protein
VSTPIPILNPYETPNGRHFNLLREAVEALRLLGGGQTTRGQYLLAGISSAPTAINDNIWVNGVKVTSSTWNSNPAKPWVQIKMDTDPWTIVEQDGPPPDTWGANDKWRRKVDLMRTPYVE